MLTAYQLLTFITHPDAIRLPQHVRVSQK